MQSHLPSSCCRMLNLHCFNISRIDADTVQPNSWVRGSDHRFEFSLQPSFEFVSLSSSKISFNPIFLSESMAAKPLTSEAIALTEKKMDMTLDDIIKMSKNPSIKGNKQQQQQRRISNKSQRPMNNAAKDKAFKVQQYMNSRASLRQGVLAQRRSNFQGDRFPFAVEAARRAAVAPFRNRAFNRRVANVSKPR
ncbi:hypothetical protein V6N11_036419 [Hibiscus sabdariffa]